MGQILAFAHYISALFSFLVGGALIGFGIYDVIEFKRTVLSVLDIGLGVIFVVTSALCFSNGKKASRLFENDT